MARYLAGTCPKCGGYLGIAISVSIRKITEFPVNGYCASCSYRLPITKIILGRQFFFPTKRYKGNHKSTLTDLRQKRLCLAPL
jgi:hypothetical protein